MENSFNGLLSQWHTLAQQSINTLGKANTQAVKTTTEQLFAGQEQMAHLLRLTLDAWAALTAGAASPDQWQQQLEAYTDQLRQQMQLALAVWQGTQHLAEQWQLYTQQWQKFSQPWLTAFTQMPALWMQSANGSSPSSTVNDLTQLFWGAFGQTWGQLLSAPSLGLTRQSNEQQKQFYAFWLDYQRTLVEYQQLLGETWIEAFTAYMQRLIGLAQTGQPLENQRQLIDLWVEVADARFLDLFHSERYAQVQSKLLNTGMALRSQQRELAEVWLRGNNLPTQSDLDEAHRNIYELRKEVKLLKKALQGGEPAPAPAAEPKPRTTKRQPSRSRAQNKNGRT